MKKILFLLLAIPNLVTANGKESNQQIDQQTAPVVTPTPPHPSIKQRLSQKAATIAKLSKDLDDLSWKNLMTAPLAAMYGAGVVSTFIYCALPHTSSTESKVFEWLFYHGAPTFIFTTGIITAGTIASIGAAKLGNSIVRKSVFGTKKVVDFVKKKLSTNTQN